MSESGWKDIQKLIKIGDDYKNLANNIEKNADELKNGLITESRKPKNYPMAIRNLGLFKYYFFPKSFDWIETLKELKGLILINIIIMLNTFRPR